MLRKFLSGLVAITLALGTVALTATPANAGRDDATISVSADISCTKDLMFQITWSVENRSEKAATVSSTSNSKVIALATSIPAKGFITGTEIVSSAQSRSLRLTVTVAGGSADASASVRSSDFPKCEPPVAKVSLCHASPPDTAAQGWNSQSVDDSSVIDGAHDREHAADIIPSFTYWKQVDGVWTPLTYPGKNLSTPFSGFTGAQILASNCTQSVTATAPTLTPSVCTAPGVVGAASYTIPTTSGVTYEVRVGAGSFGTKVAGTYPVTVPSTITIRAVAGASWVTLSGTTQWSLAYSSPGDCIVSVAPVAPTVTTITACGTSGSIVFATTTGVTYTLTRGTGLAGAWQVTATAQSGYRLTGQTVFSGNLGTRTTCATPAASTFTAAECTGPGTRADGSYMIPSTTGVTYRVSINRGTAADVASGTQFVFTFPTTVTVTAVAQSGYTLTGSTGPWSSTFADPGDCLRVSTPVSPTASPITECGNEGDLVLPTTPGVAYKLTLGDGTSGAWEVTATPATGYRFDGAQSVVFRGDLGEYTDCVTPAAPTFTPAVCTVPGDNGPGQYTIPSTVGVTYWVSIDGGTATATPAGTYDVIGLPATVAITATANTGYTLQKYTGPWEQTLESPGDCLVEVTPLAPSATAITECGTTGEVLLPKTAGVIYTITSGTGLAGAYEVTATAAAGYVITTGAQTVFPLDLGTYTECVTPAAPTFVPAVCTGPGESGSGSYVIPSTVGVTYWVSIDGATPVATGAGTFEVTALPATIEITAMADAGFTLRAYPGPWAETLDDAGDCLVAATPVAPSATVITECGTFGEVRLAKTEGVVYAITSGTGLSGAYEVTATAATGYVIESGAQTVFPLDLGQYTECVTPPAPTFVQAVCTLPGQHDNAQYVIPTTQGVAYGVALDGSTSVATPAGAYDVMTFPTTVTITASAEWGYTLEGDTDGWAVEFGGPGDCDQEVPAATVTFTESTCPELVTEQTIPGSLAIPATTGVEYWVTVNGGAPWMAAPGDDAFDAGDEVLVEAVAATGYRLAKGTTAWSHEFAADPVCQFPTLNELLPAVSVAPATCTSLGSIIVDGAEHLLYFIDGAAVIQASTPTAPGTYTVTAASDDPLTHTILDNKPFVVTVAGPSICADLATLALTGAGGSWWLAGSTALSLLTVGAIMLVIRRRESAR